jgi:plastocyanin
MSAQRATLATLAALVAATTILLAACGDDDPYVRAQEDGTVRMTLDEFRVDPERVFTPTGRVRIVARNVGRLTHNVAVVSDDRSPDAVEVEYGRSKTAQPGETVTATATLRPGRYRVVCTLANHDNLGQYGTLVVRRSGE